jgi:SNW domain-containing protein 1
MIPCYGLRKDLLSPTSTVSQGGAFPEFHFVQDPLSRVFESSSPGLRSKSSIIQPTGKDLAHASSTALETFEHTTKYVLRPEKKQSSDTETKTSRAISERLNTNPSSNLQSGNNAQYLRYKIDQSGLQTESEEHRIIKLHTIPVDPMEPAKFRRKKVPRNAQNLPVPVLHSAEKQMRTETAVDWNIPPSISNWKNPKGYSIPLDKRLAADGRNLHEQQINDNFANLSEALYLAERRARDAIQMRGQIRKELNLKEKEAKESELRKLALNAKKRNFSDRESEK